MINNRHKYVSLFMLIFILIVFGGCTPSPERVEIDSSEKENLSTQPEPSNEDISEKVRVVRLDEGGNVYMMNNLNRELEVHKASIMGGDELICELEVSKPQRTLLERDTGGFRIPGCDIESGERYDITVRFASGSSETHSAIARTSTTDLPEENPEPPSFPEIS